MFKKIGEAVRDGRWDIVVKSMIILLFRAVEMFLSKNHLIYVVLCLTSGCASFLLLMVLGVIPPGSSSYWVEMTIKFSVANYLLVFPILKGATWSLAICEKIGRSIDRLVWSLRDQVNSYQPRKTKEKGLPTDEHEEIDEEFFETQLVEMQLIENNHK